MAALAHSVAVAGCAFQDALSTRALRRLQAAWVACSLGGWAFFIALSVFPYTGVALAGLVVLGVGYAVREVAGLTLVQRLASDAVLARAFGVVEATYWLTTGLGSLLAPLLVVLTGLRTTLLIVGATLPALILLRRRALARMEASTPVPEREYRLLRGRCRAAAGRAAGGAGVPAHARALRPRRGLLREGEPGDRFY